MFNEFLNMIIALYIIISKISKYHIARRIKIHIQDFTIPSKPPKTVSSVDSDGISKSQRRSIREYDLTKLWVIGIGKVHMLPDRDPLILRKPTPNRSLLGFQDPRPGENGLWISWGNLWKGGPNLRFNLERKKKRFLDFSLNGENLFCSYQKLIDL